jgi:hypothetical protein
VKAQHVAVDQVGVEVAYRLAGFVAIHQRSADVAGKQDLLMGSYTWKNRRYADSAPVLP